VKPSTLRGRLALWSAAALAAVLCSFAAAVYLIVEAEEAAEPPEVAALEPPDHTGRYLLVALAVALPAGLAVAVGGGLWIARRALGPLDEVVRVARTVDAEVAERIALPPDAADEVRELALALNGMLDRLAHAVDGMRRFTADASHELRTPIAALMSEIEVTLRRTRSDVELRAALEGALEELGRLGRLVEALLTLARSDSRQLPVEPAPVELGQLTRQVVEPYEAVLAARQISLSLACPERIEVRTDPLWLGRAIANLVDNACKFTPAGGAVAVRVAASAGAVEIVVRDTGAGLSDEERRRVFERFYRGSGARGASDGFGLGLALAHEIVSALGGRLEAGGEKGAGAEFRIALPLAG
jgi:heavy metal sensor kinase